MGGTGEGANQVIVHDREQTIRGRDVLAPFTGAEMPENGKHPNNNRPPGRQGMYLHRSAEPHHLIGTVNGEPGKQQHEAQQRLAPVPEALKAFEHQYPAHCPFLPLNTIRAMACTSTANSVAATSNHPIRSSHTLL